MAKDAADSITIIAERAKSESRKTVERQDELDARAPITSKDLYELLRTAQTRDFIAKAITLAFVTLILGFTVAAIVGGDAVIDRVLKVNQSIIPVITLVLGFYFGSRA